MKKELVRMAEGQMMVIAMKMDKIVGKYRSDADKYMDVKDIADLERYASTLSHLSKYLSEIYSW